MAENTLIQGRYRLLDLIGRGGMGEVWRARDESLGRRVAVKCLKPLAEHGDRAFTRVLRERFRREARVAAALQHRGVTVVHDFGEHEGLLYLVMELLEGRNLSQLLEDNKQHPLPVTEVIEVAEQVASALAYTHGQGIVHRDLKPANVMRTEDGTLKICDFGIARLGHDIGFTAKLTGGGIAMGTPHYMSPEQIAGAVVDHRSDLYSLGCVLYEIATGVPPFDNDDAWSVLVGHRDTAPEPPRVHRPELPVPLEAVILGLLAKRPEQRPGDAAELTGSLAAARAVAVGPAGHTGPGPFPGPGLFPLPGPGAYPVAGQRLGVGPLWLPPWTRGMGSGSRASGSWSLDSTTASAVRAARLSGLTGQWTGLKGPVKPPLAGIAGQGGPPAVSSSSRPRGISGDGPPGDGPRGGGSLGGGPRGAGSGGHGSQGDGSSGSGTPGDGTRGPGSDGGSAQGSSSGAGSRSSREAPPRELLAVLASRHHAGLNLGRLGRWEEAGEVHRAVAAERERTLGPCHPDTLASRYESGFTLSRLGRHGEALDEYARVAAGRATAFGADHPDTLAARQESAYVLGQLGRHPEAHAVYAEVLDSRVRTMGPDHPDTLRCRHNLAFNLSRLGRLEDSYAMAREVARARVRVLGADHPDTLVTRYEVGYALGRLGRWGEALDTYQAVVEARARSLGADHPDTLAARYESGVCLGRLGRSTEALELYRDLARTRTRAQGPADPETLRALHGLGVNLGRLGRWPEALAQAREVCAARERVLGPDHPDTLVSRREIAVGLGWLGRWDDALEVYRHVSAVRDRVLGSADPDTLASRNDEAHCLEQLGRSGEAV